MRASELTPLRVSYAGIRPPSVEVRPVRYAGLPSDADAALDAATTARASLSLTGVLVPTPADLARTPKATARTAAGVVASFFLAAALGALVLAVLPVAPALEGAVALDEPLEPFASTAPGAAGMPAVLRAINTRPLEVWDTSGFAYARSAVTLVDSLGPDAARDSSAPSPPAPPAAKPRALPTNEWWTNLAMGADGDVEHGPENFVNALPYHIDVADPLRRGVRVTNPLVSVQAVANRFCQVKWKKKGKK